MPHPLRKSADFKVKPAGNSANDLTHKTHVSIGAAFCGWSQKQKKANAAKGIHTLMCGKTDADAGHRVCQSVLNGDIKVAGYPLNVECAGTCSLEGIKKGVHKAGFNADFGS
ncbi:unnamed protein product [marine sediment metagenome]|uniref:Uncharacterized protein n=1 Tax=marine sediment metagenome TaxID=412755 RepID=X0SUL6_9ZZZZ